MSGVCPDQARFRRLFLLVVHGRLGQVAVEGVVILVLDEGHGIVVIVVVQNVVLARFAHAGFFGRVGDHVVLVVGRQDGLVAFLVDLGRCDRFFFVVLVAVDLLVLDLILVGVIGGIAGRTAAAVAQLQRLLRIEVGRAFGAVGGAGLAAYPPELSGLALQR